ncbi:hypothetical protein [sulfur-oxidizing endosymbiont of Gigantopelta aegis]|uniref:hypothetical protein n=1 Tax=sulfur-oxidizing endosymbiont of Gigantopelta aegis TaxID=2794934 RepID=UPI0018DE52AF|nr:hypothetical protein [sulfur-oxidizing endosymbiont of Gigantopelta aegis]
MKTLTTLLFAVATSVSFTANAGSYDSALYGDPAINDVFPMASTLLQAQTVNTVADTGELVWSVEYEEFVNPADFNVTRTTQTTSLAGVLQAFDVWLLWNDQSRSIHQRYFHNGNDPVTISSRHRLRSRWP